MSDKLSLDWDAWNTEHIKKHNLTVREVEEAYQASRVDRPTREPRRIVFGQTKTGRRLAIIVAPSSRKNHYYVVTARDMSLQERKFYEHH